MRTTKLACASSKNVEDIGGVDRAQAIATARKAFSAWTDNDASAYAAVVTTLDQGTELASSLSDSSSVDPLLDDELVWLVQIHDVVDQYQDPVMGGNDAEASPTVNTFEADLIVYVDANNEWLTATEIPAGPG